jgi:hypothetical protein
MKQLLTIAETVNEIGSRTKVYDLIGLGHLKAVKLGSRTRVVTESLQSFLASLPEAQIAPPRSRRAA